MIAPEWVTVDDKKVERMNEPRMKIHCHNNAWPGLNQGYCLRTQAYSGQYLDFYPSRGF